MNEEMMKAMAGKSMPELAIVDNNTLAALGLKSLLESAIPMVRIKNFGTFVNLNRVYPSGSCTILYPCPSFWRIATSSLTKSIAIIPSY